MTSKPPLLLSLATLGFAVGTAQASIIFTDDLSTGAGWTMAGDTDTASTFGYDYSADGIPAAPNGTGTVGLKLEANITAGTASGIAVVRNFTSAGSAYRMTFDMWTNFAIGGSGTTEFSGGGVGSSGGASLNGASLIITGDGGSSRDYRLYKDASEQFFATLQYGPALTSNNGSDTAISAAFPGQTPPASQGQTGSADAGDAAFQWITMQIDVDPNAVLAGTTADPGTATFTITGASGTPIEIGTIDNSNGGGVVNMDGSVSLIYTDLFSSLADTPNLQFGVFDNVVVETIPEPSSGILALLGGVLALRRRR